MRKKKVWRYYCEFCRKSGCSGGHIAKHERACTANPNRVCRMCKLVGATQKPLAELLAAFDGGQSPADTDSLRELESVAEGCPACMLAAVRAWDQAHPETECSFSVHFRERCEAVWTDLHRAEIIACQHG